MPLKKFDARFGVSPASLGLPVDTILVDQKPEKGVLMLQNDEITVRSIDSVSASLHEILFNGAQQVRGDQGAEVFKAWTSDVASRPKALSKADLHSMTLASVAEKARATKEKAAAEAEKLQQVHANLPAEAPQAEAEAAEAAEPEQEEEEEVVTSGIAAPLLLPSARSQMNKRKVPKGEKESARKRLKAKTSVCDASQAAESSVAGSGAREESASMAPSSSLGSAVVDDNKDGSEPKKKLTAEEKALQKAKSWIDLIVLENVLAGDNRKMNTTSHGRELWQAKSTLDAIENNSNLKGCVESVLLAAHLEVANLAEELHRTEKATTSSSEGRTGWAGGVWSILEVGFAAPL